MHNKQFTSWLVRLYDFYYSLVVKDGRKIIFNFQLRSKNVYWQGTEIGILACRVHIPRTVYIFVVTTMMKTWPKLEVFYLFNKLFLHTTYFC